MNTKTEMMQDRARPANQAAAQVYPTIACMLNSGDCYDWLHYWDAYKSGLTRLLTTNSIQGYYMTEELAITKLLQVEVLPHIHAIIDSDGLDDATITELGQSVSTALRASSAQLLDPGIVAEPIHSRLSLTDHLKYMFKPVNLVKAYESDWFNHCSDNRRLAWRLNSNTTDVVLGYSHVNRRRNKMTGKGTLNSRCKEYIGKRTKELHKYKSELAAIRNGSRQQYIEMPEIEYDMSGDLN